MRLKKTNVAVIILMLCLLPITSIYTVSASKNKEITCMLLLERPEKQVVLDEIIDALESLGLTLTIDWFYDYDEWVAHSHVHGAEYDITYGGLMYSWDIDNIFNLAWLLYMYNEHMWLNTDKKFDTYVQTLWDMFNDAMVTPEIATEEYLEEMTKIFNKIEKRLWVKKYVLPFVQWEGFFAPFGMDIKFMEGIGFNTEDGRVFSNIAYRWALQKLIDRDVFMDYHAIYNPYDVYEVYHIFQMSALHDDHIPDF